MNSNIKSTTPLPPRPIKTIPTGLRANILSQVQNNSNKK